MRYALGIDGGGSKCEAVALDEEGRVVGVGLGGPVHVYYDPPEVIAASYADAVRGALAEVEEGEVWVAGHVPSPEALAEVLGDRRPVGGRLSASEMDTAFASANLDWGLIVLAGTGSFVHGRAEDGRHLHFGGAGPILGDYGSGYAIGLAALRAASAPRWAKRRQTSLKEAVPRGLGVADWHGVFHLVYVDQINRRRVATLAKVVDEEAEAGDAIAQACLQRAADDLADTVVELLEELGFLGQAFPVVLIGSVAQHSRRWRERILERIHAVAPEAWPVIPAVSPAVGAALLARRQMGEGGDREAWYARAAETYGGKARGRR
jgi:N-acetylglucosamine kinase-like BadF-type ATPase